MAVLELAWSVPLQRIAVDGDVFEHEGDPGTDVAHDFCHLVVAAHEGPLLWKPKGPDREIRIAEFNAVFLEWLYFRIFTRLVAREPIGDALAFSEEHAVEFVERFYAPFPIPFEDARRSLLEELEPELVTGLFPAYVDCYLEREIAKLPPFPTVRARFESGSRERRYARAQLELERLLEEAQRAL